MQEALQKQDDMLDELAVGVDRLKNTTKAVHDEAQEQDRLLGDIEGDANKAETELHSDTILATARIKEDQSVWKLQMVVVGLSVFTALILLKGLT
mmetsp:Transcript_17333/g.47319  ORF Transcript_17333/g.47319 Transcript_17333/m.47319 type:complete len:95 (+) Transcript_17333:1-285(+)